MGSRLNAQQRLDRATRSEDLRETFTQTAELLGWRPMHIADSRKVVRSAGQTYLVGDKGCKGWPDVFLVHARTGRALAVEVKNELEDPTPAQQEWLDDLATVPGIETFVLRPSNWSEGRALLTARRAVAA